MPKFFPEIALYSCGAILLSVPANAQTVQGILVREKSQAPIGGAHLSLVDDSGHGTPATTSDSSSGTFYLDVPKPGRYKLRVLLGRGGLSYSPAFQVDSGQTIERKFAIPDWPRAVLEAYLPDDVTTPATLDGPQRGPRYPEHLRQQNRGGVVRVRFVVDTRGKADMSTFAPAQSEDPSLTDSAKRFVDDARFVPAKIGGSAVPQVMEMVFDFGIGNAPPQVHDKDAVIIRATGVYR